MRIMILGAGGYLGKRLSDCLAKHYAVTGVYRSVPEDTGRIHAITADRKDILSILKQERYDWIINCVTVYERKDVPPYKILDANLFFGLNVLNLAAEYGVKGFITFDTGLPEKLNLYSFTKKRFAEFGSFYSEKCGIVFLNILLEMFYGEDEPEGRFLSDACRKMLRGEELKLTAGTQKRDIIYIDDICNAILLLLDSRLTGFRNVPLGSGEAVEIRQVMKYMHFITGSKSILRFGSIPLREGEPDCVADMTLLKEIGFQPHYPWKKGLKQLCDKIMQAEELR